MEQKPRFVEQGILAYGSLIVLRQERSNNFLVHFINKIASNQLKAVVSISAATESINQ